MRRLLLAALIVAAACAGPAPRDPDRLIVALGNSPTNLDPGVGLDEASQRIHALIYSSLMKIGDDLRPVPDLAVRLDTTDRQTYVAEIPPGVHFQNGREMTADDVAYTFRRFLDPAFVSGRKGAYKDLLAVDVLDRYTVAFRLRGPSTSFPANLTNMGIVPAGSDDTLARHPVGSGPYRLDAFVPDDHLTLSAFAGYYRGAPANAGLTFKIVPDETMRGLELRNGSVDLVVNDLSPDLVHSLAENPALQVVTRPGTDYGYIGINLRDPVLRDRRVRQAIGYAIDRRAIVHYLRRDQARETASIIPSMSWAHADDLFRFTHDPVRARALLDAAGYPDPDGPGPRPRLHLTLKTSTAERYRLQATVLQQQLAQVGIDLEIRSVRVRHAVLRRGAGQFPALYARVRRGIGRRSRHPAPGVRLPAGTAGRLQPGPLRESGGRPAHRAGHGGLDRGGPPPLLRGGRTADHRGRPHHQPVGRQQCHRRAARSDRPPSVADRGFRLPAPRPPRRTDTRFLTRVIK